MKNNNRKIITTILILLIAVVGYFAYGKFAKVETVKGNKNITVIVKSEKDKYEKEHKHSTDAEFLGKALDEMKIIDAEKSQFGRYVNKVDEILADKNKQEWWKLTINGGDSTTGIDETPIADGDRFEFILTTGW